MAISERKARVLRQREQEILQAAGELFRRGDWHRTTIDEIAKNAEVGKGTVYLHFKNKEEIVERLALMGCKRLLGRIHRIPTGGRPEERVRGLIGAARHVLQDHPETLAWLATARSGRATEGGGGPCAVELEAVRSAIVETTARIVSGTDAEASPAPGAPDDPGAIAAAGFTWGALAALMSGFPFAGQPAGRTTGGPPGGREWAALEAFLLNGWKGISAAG